MYEAQSAKYIRIHESIEFRYFFDLNYTKYIHDVSRFDIHKPRNIYHPEVTWLSLYIVPDVASFINKNRFVDPNLLF